MAKSDKVRYVCSNCGAVSMTWSGRCNQCGEWNTLQEQVEINAESLARGGHMLTPSNITQLTKTDTLKRLQTGMGDVDTVLGGGIVQGSVTLIAGQPGIGK